MAKVAEIHYSLGVFEEPGHATDALLGCYQAVRALRLTDDERTGLRFYIDQYLTVDGWRWELFTYGVPTRYRSAFGAYDYKGRENGRR
jgi:hypothetical protein